VSTKYVTARGASADGPEVRGDAGRRGGADGSGAAAAGPQPRARVPNTFIPRIETEIGLNRSEVASPMFVNNGVACGGMGSV
jgi:hypothetical protein